MIHPSGAAPDEGECTTGDGPGEPDSWGAFGPYKSGRPRDLSGLMQTSAFKRGACKWPSPPLGGRPGVLFSSGLRVEVLALL